ncbi:MAG: GNAT family N-acetyltransferase [Candidatus Odinarchaeota archaeon]
MLWIRKFQQKDSETVSALIREALRETLGKDYPGSVIQKLCDDYTPSYIRDIAHQQEILVAIIDDRIVGTAAFQDNIIRDVYVHPDYQRQGIGNKLINQVEKTIKELGYSYVQLPANPTALEFYRKLGYSKVEEVHNETYGIIEIIIRKDF